MMRREVAAACEVSSRVRRTPKVIADRFPILLNAQSQARPRAGQEISATLRAEMADYLLPLGRARRQNQLVAGLWFQYRFCATRK